MGESFFKDFTCELVKVVSARVSHGFCLFGLPFGLGGELFVLGSGSGGGIFTAGGNYESNGLVFLGGFLIIGRLKDTPGK